MRRTKTTSSAGSRESSARTRRPLARPRARVIVLVVAVAGLLVVGGIMLGSRMVSAMSGSLGRVSATEERVGSDPSAQVVDTSGALVAQSSSGMVEVPQLVGMRVDEAMVVLETAGLKVGVVDEGVPVSFEASRVVLAQQPTQGTVLSVDSTVSITAPPLLAGDSATLGAAETTTQSTAVVCIDPGHQEHADVRLEPVGPGSKTEKPRASGGATGVSTGVPEYEIALEIAMNLKKRLEAAGVTVVMTRTTNDVSLSNSQRAIIANKAKADLFVRIHGGVSIDPEESGVVTVFPAKNHWTASIFVRSRAAANAIEQSVCRMTGAVVRAVRPQGEMAGFNWSKAPAVLIETGFLSNPLEDQLMASPNYQDKLAEGISQGVRTYLSRQGK